MRKTVFVLAAMTALVVAAASVQAQEMIEDGKSVAMDYTLTVAGEVVDTSEGKEPLEYTQGAGEIISGLEQQMEGMKEGESKKIMVEAEDAYGPVNPNAVREIPRERFPEEVNLQPGMVIPLRDNNGNSLPARIDEVNGDMVVLDFNHPLAGQDLTFDVTVVDIR